MGNIEDLTERGTARKYLLTGGKAAKQVALRDMVKEIPPETEYSTFEKSKWFSGENRTYADKYRVPLEYVSLRLDWLEMLFPRIDRVSIEDITEVSLFQLDYLGD